MKKLCIILLVIVVISTLISSCSDSSTKNEEMTSPAASSEVSATETAKQEISQDTSTEEGPSTTTEQEGPQVATDEATPLGTTEKATPSTSAEEVSPTATPAKPPETLFASVFIDGLTFPECPRWHDGKLWFSDIHAGKVMTVNMGGELETIVEVPANPGGLGWLPTGELLVVSMRDSRVLTYDSQNLKELCNLSNLAPDGLNDMVVDVQGRAYVGESGGDEVFVVPPDGHVSVAADGFMFPNGGDEVFVVTPDGHASIAADGFMFPNGSVITPDGRTIVIAESSGMKLSAFDINSDGTLMGKRTWVSLDLYANGQLSADGICIDSAGGIWVATTNSYVVRFVEGGEMTHVVRVSQRAFACALGGPDLRTLFILTAPVTSFITLAEETKAAMRGRIETVRVDIPGIE